MCRPGPLHVGCSLILSRGQSKKCAWIDKAARLSVIECMNIWISFDTLLFVALSKLMFSSGVKPVQAEQLPVKRITELKAAHKASRQRYKFNVKKTTKQIRVGVAGRTPPYSCTRYSSITQCEFITQAACAELSRVEAGLLQVRDTDTSAHSSWLTGRQTDECHAMNSTADKSPGQWSSQLPNH